MSGTGLGPCLGSIPLGTTALPHRHTPAREHLVRLAACTLSACPSPTRRTAARICAFLCLRNAPVLRYSFAPLATALGSHGDGNGKGSERPAPARVPRTYPGQNDSGPGTAALPAVRRPASGRRVPPVPCLLRAGAGGEQAQKHGRVVPRLRTGQNRHLEAVLRRVPGQAGPREREDESRVQDGWAVRVRQTSLARLLRAVRRLPRLP